MNHSIADRQFSNVIPIRKFCFLYIITLGLYQLPWCHKQWDFLKKRENLNINPWLRSVFFSFTIYNLAKKIFVLAERQGYRKTPSAFQVTFIYWIFIVLSLVPALSAFIGLFSFVPYLIILKAVNYYWKQEQPNLPVRESFSRGEVVWIVFGVIFWLLIIILGFLASIP